MQRWAVILVVGLVCGACSKAPERKATYPVTGMIKVDGQIVPQLAVRCHDTKGIDKADPTVSAAYTDAEGKFQISTFKSGDGVPVGDYALTFAWGEINLISMQYSGDKFNGKYSDPATSPHKFTVKEGVPTDLGTIELTTK
jgi:hypothetical protein